jgi:hypothetical protein
MFFHDDRLPAIRPCGAMAEKAMVSMIDWCPWSTREPPGASCPVMRLRVRTDR